MDAPQVSKLGLLQRLGYTTPLIDRHYGHLARDGRECAIKLVDTFTSGKVGVHQVDAAPNAPSPIERT